MQDDHLSRSRAAEESENDPASPAAGETMGEIIAARFGRRELVKGALAVGAIAAALPASAFAQSPVVQPAAASPADAMPSFKFQELAAGAGDNHHVAPGYDADVLIRWGDKVLPDAKAFDPKLQTADAQSRQFGYNNDFLGYLPLNGSSEHGLLVVNHEYTNEELMFPGLGRQDRGAKFKGMTREIIDIEMMAHGGSIIEIRKTAGKWAVVEGSKYARRITVETPMAITGPAAGHERMKTSYDPGGVMVRGMLNNCGGAMTPWGTWLSCEENINGVFWGKEMLSKHKEAAAFKRYGIPGEWYAWGKYHYRFDIAKEPNEANRFGWVVEIDPLDPGSTPKKRTALGRFKHEGAGNIVNKDGRFVIYQGDDQVFDYIYKFVTAGTVNLADRAANKDLLDAGTLYVAKYKADGVGEWLPLVFGEGPLTAKNGFSSQADVVIGARQAADLLGATKMDRPEDVEVNAKTGKVYAMLTKNSGRKTLQVDPANPRKNNAFGHIIEMTPAGGDHAAREFTWEILVKCGDPSIATVGASFNPRTTKDGWFANPDNCAIDADGRLWIATDGNSEKSTGRNDGIWAMETEGAARGTSKLFYRVPHGAEMCGPEFTPDMTTFFVAVQHPGERDDADRAAPIATYEDPTTRWPDFKPGMPPRPSVVAITRKGGGKIGG